MVSFWQWQHLASQGEVEMRSSDLWVGGSAYTYRASAILEFPQFITATLFPSPLPRVHHHYWEDTTALISTAESTPVYTGFVPSWVSLMRCGVLLWRFAWISAGFSEGVWFEVMQTEEKSSCHYPMSTEVLSIHTKDRVALKKSDNLVN